MNTLPRSNETHKSPKTRLTLRQLAALGMLPAAAATLSACGPNNTAEAATPTPYETSATPKTPEVKQVDIKTDPITGMPVRSREYQLTENQYLDSFNIPVNPNMTKKDLVEKSVNNLNAYIMTGLVTDSDASKPAEFLGKLDNYDGGFDINTIGAHIASLPLKQAVAKRVYSSEAFNNGLVKNHHAVWHDNTARRNIITIDHSASSPYRTDATVSIEDQSGDQLTGDATSLSVLARITIANNASQNTIGALMDKENVSRAPAEEETVLTLEVEDGQWKLLDSQVQP